MHSITTSYSLKWRYKKDHKYQWSKCGKLINTQRGKEIKKVLNGGSIGYCINGKFITLKRLRTELEVIPKSYW